MVRRRAAASIRTDEIQQRMAVEGWGRFPASGSYEREAMLGGLTAVLKLANSRVRDLPALDQAARAAVVAGSEQPVFARRAIEGADLALTAVELLPTIEGGRCRVFGQMQSAIQLSCVPLFMLAAAQTKPPVLLVDVLRSVRPLHYEMASRWEIVGDGGALLGELREFVAMSEDALSKGKWPARGPSARLNAVLLDAYVEHGIDRTRLPPTPEDLAAIFYEVSIATDEPEAIRTALGDWARYLAEGERPSPAAMRSLWFSLTESEVAACDRARGRLVNRNATWTLCVPDPRFDVEAARWAIEALPRRRTQKRWPGDLALNLLQLHWWISGSAAPDARRPHGHPEGRAHKFVVDAFKLYHLPLVGIDSGQYLRSASARFVR